MRKVLVSKMGLRWALFGSNEDAYTKKLHRFLRSITNFLSSNQGRNKNKTYGQRIREAVR